MIIEITGTSTHNKGAELMLAAVAGHFDAKHTSIQTAVTPHAGPFPLRARYGCLQVNHVHALGRSRLGLSLLPASCRRAFGIVNDREVGAVLDASGFAFGDSLGVARCETFARDVLRWKRQGRKLVLLPQAFGPFENPRIAEAFRRVVDSCDLVYAREAESHRYAISAAGAREHLRIAPDFTCMVKPAELPERFQSRAYVVIVPNMRLVEHGFCSPQAWRSFALELGTIVSSHGWKPVLLVHDGSGVDRELLGDLQGNSAFEIFWDDDPRVLKAVLGGARLVVGSRYHALVSALCQGVPAIALGWSHKYTALLEEYGCPTCEASINDWPEVLAKVLPRIKDTSAWDSWHRALLHEASQVRDRVASMWKDVDACLGLAET